MKVLIWVLTLFFGALINNMIGEATGIKAGALVLFIAEGYLARKLCEKWDDHLAEKAARKREMANDSKNAITVSDDSELTANSDRYETATVQERMLPEKNTSSNAKSEKIAINSKYGPIVFCADASSTNGVPINYVGFCPQCGAAYGKDSICCDKCGTRL